MKIIGISPAHDSSVCILNEGKIQVFYKEERLTRKKRDKNPYKSIIAALELVDYKLDYACIASPIHIDGSVQHYGNMLEKLSGSETVDYASRHHLCHASLAFYNSGFDDSLVFVIDRNGSILNFCLREAETIFHASYPCKFEILHKNYWIENLNNNVDKCYPGAIEILNKQNFSYSADSLMSIVRVYETATSLIGQSILENGKTMGLASYGKNHPFPDLFENNRPNDDLFVHGQFNPHLEKNGMTCLYKNLSEILTKKVSENDYHLYANYAYQVQKQTQQQVLNLVQKWIDKTGVKNVCITGGYGLNVIANQFLIENLPNINFYFEPLADDSGNSIGAAMHYYRSKTKDSTINKLKNTFFHGIKKPYKQIGEKCTINDIAEMIKQQKTVAVYNGLAEAGPRSLGNRSILFDACNSKAKDIVNNIKKREWYRPFAGIILEECFSDYFETNGLSKSEFMTISFKCKKPEIIPGIVHVDNTCRIQTVNKSISHIYELLKCLNIPVILNTSFNIAGEPLIETQEDAIECFNKTDLDVLWFPELNSWLIKSI